MPSVVVVVVSVPRFVSLLMATMAIIQGAPHDAGGTPQKGSGNGVGIKQYGSGGSSGNAQSGSSHEVLFSGAAGREGKAENGEKEKGGYSLHGGLRL